MAYSNKIVPPSCTCGKPATHEVFGNRNDPYGPRCDDCAEALAKDLNDMERQQREG